MTTTSSLLEELGLVPVINATGATSRLGGNLLSAPAREAMLAAGQSYIPLDELQARASEAIARATGAEAGCVASGAAACLFLAVAASMTGTDVAAMDRLPDTRGLRNEIVVHRAHRNPYDHALRATGARLVEVGYLGAASSPGTRDWELAAAITDRTCAFFYVATGLPDREVLPLATVVEIAHRHCLPVIVDAAGASSLGASLTQFIGEGADLVAFSGGKGVGGPAGSGFLAGRRDLILAATVQQQDMYVHPATWSGPFGDAAPGSAEPPRQGIGRMLKVGREEIAGLIAALESYAGRDHAADDAEALALATEIADRLQTLRGAKVSLVGPPDSTQGQVIVDFSAAGGPARAAEVSRRLRGGRPRVFCLDTFIHQGILVVKTPTLRPGEAAVVVERLVAECDREKGHTL